LKPGAAANLAGLACHERTDAIASELAPSFFVEPLDLRNESFKRVPLFIGTAVTAETHLDWLIAGPKVKRFLKSLGQFGKRHVFIDIKVFYERTLQVPVNSALNVCFRTTTRFPPHLSAVSIESVRRTRIASRTTRRSTTASIVCRSFFLSRIGSGRSSSAIWPSIRTRMNPSRLAFSI